MVSDSILEAEDERSIDSSGLLYAVKQMKHFISQMTEDGVGIPLIQAHAEELITLGDLEREINSCIDDHGDQIA